METPRTATGDVLQVIGPVVDCEFPADAVPEILDALHIEREEGTLVLEVQQHLGENRVRTIAMDSTDGLTRGTTVANTGSPIQMPTGEAVRGRKKTAPRGGWWSLGDPFGSPRVWGSDQVPPNF